MRYTIFFNTINDLHNFIETHVKSNYTAQNSEYERHSCVVLTETDHPKKAMITKAKLAKGYVSNT